MKHLFSAIALMLMAMNLYALPEWPRKYATAVIRGHVVGLPKDMTHGLSITQASNIKGESFPSEITDSAGVFSMKWETCWPISQSITAYGFGINLMVCPGDTIDIAIDYGKAQEQKDDTRRLYSEAIRITGTHVQYSPEYKTLARKLLLDAAVIDKDAIKALAPKGFAAYRQWAWEKHLARLDSLKASALGTDEQELLQMALEQSYVRATYIFGFLMKVSECDSLVMAKATETITEVDPNAASLRFPHSINAAYFFDTPYLSYLKANGLDELPLGQYLKERNRAETAAGELKAYATTTTDIESLTPEFRQPLYELKEKMEADAQGKQEWRPGGEPETWLPQIVDRHPGRVVLVDFWATWCGPCQKGIAEMEKVKADYEKRGVSFVYITDNSSTAGGFRGLKDKHTGDHFMFTKGDMSQMKIPQYTGSIPHYVVYDRNGRLFKTQTGWGGLESMTKMLDEALEQ